MSNRSPAPARRLPLRPGDRVSLRDVVEEIVRGASDRGDARGVRVSVDVPATTTVDVDRRSLSRVLSTLLSRALDGAREGTGPCRPEVLLTGVVCPDGVEIEVAASGAPVDPAVAAAVRRHAGMPAATRTVRGTWVDEVIREAALVGGTLTATDCPEGGAAVTLRLPLRQAAARRRAA